MSSIQLKRGTSSQWFTLNPTLKNGELGVETDTKKIKLGNGITQWRSLNYINVLPADLENTLGSYIESSEKGNAGGVATLNSSGVIPDSQIPSTIARDTEIVTSYNDLDDLPALFSGSYTDLSDKPTLFSGSYEDLSSKPTIPSLSGYATETYVGTAISNLVDSAPEALNTLNELAAAINDDSSYASTITTALGTKEPLLPSQDGNSGKFLTTDGISKSWSAVDSLPDQTNNSDKYLKTDGSNASWATIPVTSAATTNTLGTVYGKISVPGVSGNNNTSIGYNSLNSLTTGSSNVSLGNANAQSITDGISNVTIGNGVLGYMSSGDSNIAVGNLAGGSMGGPLVSGSNNILIGSNVEPSNSTISNEITLGNASITRFRIPGLGIDWTSSTVPSGSGGGGTAGADVMNIMEAW